ncbi:LOW QUALITY PROTEIN: hypothetical protein PHMEG_0009288 [Phytophthora megakarya]|uniref:Uncharacterized protein n=1 Tax=Phytophthora megakarya TaxID=4795 RepID=A0A225WGL0_9STRA|nr:LOW QUALITY PROTEIN: hypothetical protein PHMEG_0009288 [Phytophthora megakarya]
MHMPAKSSTLCMVQAVLIQDSPFWIKVVSAPNTWCDDHTCVEVDTGPRCFEANLSLRRAMSTVLGPEAINEETFTRCYHKSSRYFALGLLWDTTRGCVSIPIEKIEKARHRIHAVLNGSSFPVSVIRPVLGSLRYIATCFPPARAFYQNLQAFETTFRRFEKRSVPPDVIDDLRWFLEVLPLEDKLNSIPVEYFSNAAEPSIFIYVDASDTGLCALEPRLKQYIRGEFSEETRQNFSVSKAENSINVRDLMRAVLAALHWGSMWANSDRHRSHICFYITSTSAVSWLSKRSSSHPVVRLYNRLLSLAEFRYSLVFSAAHIPGEENVMADAGSRA